MNSGFALEKKEVLSIQVTGTWQDLMNQPGIPMEKGTARVGIEAYTAPFRSGLLVYCLTENYSPVEWEENRLGPFKIDVRHEDDGAVNAQLLSFVEAPDLPDTSQSTVLFRRAIHLDRPGRFLIRILSLDNTVLAQTAVTATKEEYHPWMPLEYSTGTESEVEEDDDAYDAAARLRNKENGIAIPRYDGMKPLRFKSEISGENLRKSAEEKLPTLFPAEHAVAGSGLSIRAEGTDIVVESKEDIILARPDWHFLARWWVNGQPYEPKQSELFSDENGIYFTGKKMLIKLDFRPQWIGAESGDTVDLQLLYCRNGWELVSLMESALAFHEMDGPELLISNRTRIEWGTDENPHPGN